MLQMIIHQCRPISIFVQIHAAKIKVNNGELPSNAVRGKICNKLKIMGLAAWVFLPIGVIASCGSNIHIFVCSGKVCGFESRKS
ncbi:MAG: hypothetical protein Ta2B_09880 [Termitinemataceae bacterium]|nr:MAG: hypothetical protein Ta2B_09880 [Termitinemataceae bacterium]